MMDWLIMEKVLGWPESKLDLDGMYAAQHGHCSRVGGWD